MAHRGFPARGSGARPPPRGRSGSPGAGRGRSGAGVALQLVRRDVGLEDKVRDHLGGGALALHRDRADGFAIIDLGAQSVRRRLVEGMRTVTLIVSADRLQNTRPTMAASAEVRGRKMSARAAGRLDRRGDAQRLRADIGRK